MTQNPRKEYIVIYWSFLFLVTSKNPSFHCTNLNQTFLMNPTTHALPNPSPFLPRLVEKPDDVNTSIHYRSCHRHFVSLYNWTNLYIHLSSPLFYVTDWLPIYSLLSVLLRVKRPGPLTHLPPWYTTLPVYLSLYSKKNYTIHSITSYPIRCRSLKSSR